MNEQPTDIRNKRFALFILITAVFLLLLIWKFFDVMILNPRTGNPGAAPPPAVERGPILDRNGNILAVQTRLHAVTAWMPNVLDPPAEARLLGEALEIDPNRLLSRMEQGGRFLYIKRKASPSESDLVAALIDEGKLPGIGLEPEFGRNYPERKLASHVLGFVGTDNTGLDGIEYTYDSVLSPPPLEDDGAERRYGNQLFLSLDLNIQYFAEELGQEAYETYNPDGVMIMVMDARNGDFLAWSSHPNYDPNHFSRASKLEKQNRPLVTAYEPGSVFKVFSIASFIELGGITPASSFYCDGSYERTFPNGEQIRINCLGNHGNVHAEEILKYSCNAGTGYASDTVTKSAFYRKLSEFGFGSATHLPLPGETNGILRKPEIWSGRTKPTIAIGQEISVSAVQVLTATTALCNDGYVLEPHIVKKIVSPEGKTLEYFSRRPVKQVLSKENAQAMLLMMESVSQRGGTGWRAAIDDTRVSIKTGTGEMIDPETGKYSKEAVLASALAIFPTEDPRFIVYIVIDHPRGPQYYGGRIAAPMVKEIGEELIRYYGIPRSRDRELVHDGTIRVQPLTPARIPFGGPMPDLSGYSKRQLMPLLQDSEYPISIKGTGWVVRQSPAPGTHLSEGDAVILELE